MTSSQSNSTTYGIEKKYELNKKLIYNLFYKLKFNKYFKYQEVLYIITLSVTRKIIHYKILYGIRTLDNELFYIMTILYRENNYVNQNKYKYDIKFFYTILTRKCFDRMQY